MRAMRRGNAKAPLTYKLLNRHRSAIKVVYSRGFQTRGCFRPLFTRHVTRRMCIRSAVSLSLMIAIDYPLENRTPLEIPRKH